MALVNGRPLGAAHRGLEQFLVQRATAVVLAVFILYLAGRFAACPVADYAQWKDWMTPPHIRLGTVLAIVALLLHAWIGLRSVYLDYLHAPALRVSVSAFTAAALVAMGTWAGDILLWGFRP
jgi:succinate dehydrogenase / fumarate reductase membrane anchor subunit